jgi:hypothetical protein
MNTLNLNNTLNTEYISLGCNCSIAYQLDKYNIRHNSHIFDWCNSTINQIINALEDNLAEYISTLSITDFSNKHKYIKLLSNNNENNIIYEKIFKNLLNVQGTYKCKNKYGITLSHELINKNDLSILKEKLSRRVDRFLNLQKSKYDILNFIRLEKQVINLETYLNKIYIILEWIIKNIKNKKIKFTIILNKINNNINEYIENNNKFKKIINENNIELNLHFYDKFTSDWQMNNVLWHNVFNI